MVVLQHEHSLSLIDLNPKYPHDEEVYDDEVDLIIKQAFQCPCHRCNQEITYLHRYYYKCDQCDYSLHKLCESFPTELQHASHGAHTLTLFLDESQGQCDMCKITLQCKQIQYHCSRCMFNICLECALDKVQYHTIYHPSHQHPLIPACRQRQILAECDACGKKHNGVFYECTTCFRSLIHKDCVFQPKRRLIQDGTCGRFYHTHPLVLAYSFPIVHQKAKFYPTCRVCDNSFSDNENIWVYKCEKCRYYAHADCANSICKPSNSNSSPDRLLYYGGDQCKDYKSFKERYCVLDFPIPDLTYNIFTDLLSIQSNNEMSITHNSHDHPLIFVDSRCNDISKVEADLCNGCDTPIMAMPFYKCANGCNFVLHECCTRLPAELKGHQSYYYYNSKVQHALSLLPKVPSDSYCCHCHKRCKGFAYFCVICGYIHVWCALTPRFITHKSHPYHLFGKLIRDEMLGKDYCRVCLSGFTYPEEASYSCVLCNFHLHPRCALLLPATIRHKYDKHPLTITYSPVENHGGDYFCEVCEEELNPNAAFYHCHECAQSIHTACAPLTPQLKAYIHGLHVKCDYETDFHFSSYKAFINFSESFAKMAGQEFLPNSK